MRRLATAGLVTAVLVAASGCGSSPSSGGNGSTSQKASFAAFTACLKQHGVSLPGGGQGFGGGAPPSSGGGFNGTPPSGGQFNGTPPSGGGFPGSAKMQKAIQACQSLAPKRSGSAPSFGSGG